jgi:hypothetical protein
MKKNILWLSLFSFSVSSFGWGDIGHAAIGYIAEQNLSLQGKKFVYDILGGEPLGLSAIFPDKVRDDARFNDFSPYHFFEIPYGFSYETLPHDRKAVKSADTILTQGPGLILSKHHKKRLSLTQKQTMLRYFVHILGDVHQPLHIGNGLDMGANLCSVWVPNKVTGKTTKINLHAVWDETLIEQMKEEIIKKAQEAGKPIKYFSYRHFGDALIAEAKENQTLEAIKNQVGQTTLSNWYAESRSFHQDVYPDKIPGTLPKDRTFCRVVNPETGQVEDGKFDEASIPTLTDDYLNKSYPLIKKQILLASFRLLNEIEKMAKLAKSGKLTPEWETKFFKKMQPETPKEQAPSSFYKLRNESKDWCHYHHQH